MPQKAVWNSAVLAMPTLRLEILVVPFHLPDSLTPGVGAEEGLELACYLFLAAVLQAFGRDEGQDGGGGLSSEAGDAACQPYHLGPGAGDE